VSGRLQAFAYGLYAWTIWVLVAGTLVTAAGPHGGDREARRLDWPIGDAARVHGLSVDILVGGTLCFVVLLIRSRVPQRVLVACSATLAAMIAQGVLGYVQYARAIPPLLVGFHVFGAVVVFGTMQWLLLELRTVEPADVQSPVLTSRPIAAAHLQ